MVACVPTSNGCTSADDEDNDGTYEASPTCTPPEGMEDCDDTRDYVKPGPGRTEGSCFETNPELDEDCDDKTNCFDSDCRMVHGDDCDSVCDRDGDGVDSEACGGPDCEDDPSKPGSDTVPNNTYEYEGVTQVSCQDNLNNDCTQGTDCADPKCSETYPSQCATPTPTPSPTPEDDPQIYSDPPYCYSFYAVTNWYISYDGGNTWSYYTSTYQYLGSSCELIING